MVISAVLGLAFGAVLAQYCRAFVLLPATLVTLVGVLLSEATSGHTVAYASMASLCVVFALQLGFLIHAYFASGARVPAAFPASQS